MTYKTLQTNFERELLFHLIFSLKRKKITKEQGQKIAKEFLSVLRSANNPENFMEQIAKIAPYYLEIRETFLKVIPEYEEENVKDRLQNIRQTLKGGII